MAQISVWIGVLITFYLLFYPYIETHLFWNILIPIALAFLMVTEGVWRTLYNGINRAISMENEFFKREIDNDYSNS